MKTTRDLSVDVTRGVAVLLMIVSHSIFFRYGLNNSVLTTLLLFGNLYCYTTFLLTFGIGSYFWRYSSWGRTGILLATYYAAGLASIWAYGQLSQWRYLLVWQYYPPFTEYLPSFALFTFLITVFRSLITRLSGWMIMTASLGLLIIGHLVTINSPLLRPLFGTPLTFDFPVLQYSFVVALGICLARMIASKHDTKEYLLLATAYIFFVLDTLLSFSFRFTHAFDISIPWFNTEIRWPPSLLFIVRGLKWSLFTLVATRMAMRAHPLVKSLLMPLIYIGQRALGYLVYHLLVLFAMKGLALPMFGEIWELSIFVLALLLSYSILERCLSMLYLRLGFSLAPSVRR